MMTVHSDARCLKKPVTVPMEPLDVGDLHEEAQTVHAVIASNFFRMKNVEKSYLERISHLDSLKVMSEMQLLLRLIELDAIELTRHVRAEHMTTSEIASVPAVWQEGLTIADPARPKRGPVIYETGYMPDPQALMYNSMSLRITNRKLNVGLIEITICLSRPVPVTYFSNDKACRVSSRAEHRILSGPNMTLKMWFD